MTDTQLIATLARLLREAIRLGLQHGHASPKWTGPSRELWDMQSREALAEADRRAAIPPPINAPFDNPTRGNFW